MKPIIQAAVESGRPPLELLLDQPDRKRSKLDGILIKALALEKAYELEGYPIWVEESDRVSFRSKHRDVRSVAVVEKAQEAESRKKHPTPGRRFYAEAVLLPGATWPTRQEWIESRASGKVYADDVSMPERRAEAEERAREKAADNPAVAAIIAEFEDRFKTRTGRMD